jgi:hypothetical protein
LIPRIIAKYPAHALYLMMPLNITLIQLEFVIGGPHGTQDLQEEKSLLIRMEEKELTVVFSLERSK